MRLRAISYAVPSWHVGNETIAQWSGLEPAFIAERIGVSSRSFLRSNETATGLAAAACRKLFTANPELDAGMIDLIVLVTQNPDYKLPHGAALLQHALGLGVGVATFDINLGCSGYVYALGVTRSLMLTEEFANALIVTCDPYSKIMGRDNRDVIGLFGDAATATWLSRESGAEIGRGDYGTDGSGAKHLMVRGGGSAGPFDHLDGHPCPPPEPQDVQLHMNGRAIFNFMMARVPETIDRCLARNGRDIQEIDYFVFHQASRFLLEQLVDRLQLPADKVPISMAHSGNTVSSTLPMVLADLLENNELEGRLVLISGFGVGLSWASNILSFGARNES